MVIERPAVAVLICTMDRPAALRGCLDAIMSGTELPSQIVVVDQSVADGSTRELAEAVRDAAPPGCRVVHVRSAGGMARGQNDGIAVVDAEVVLVTDDDCVPAPDWVQTAHSTFAADGSIGLVGGRVLPLGPESRDALAVASRTSTEPLELDHRSEPWMVGSGNNFAVRLDAIRGVGGNDERLGPGARYRGGADMDLFRRILRAGVRGAYEPALVVLHERATRKQRRQRQIPYGYGMGLACALWWRQGDDRAAGLARRYVALRLRRGRHAVRHLRIPAVYEEVLVLLGAVRGAGRGLLLIRDPGPMVRTYSEPEASSGPPTSADA